MRIEPTRNMTADNQELNLGCSFVGDETFHVAQVAYDMEIERDPIAAKNIARHPAHFARFDTAVILSQCRHRFFQFTVVDQPTQSDAIELDRGDVAQHVDEH